MNSGRQAFKPVGLTGGIASGKSTVAGMFEELGALIISGDAVAAEVMVPGSPALIALAREFGHIILAPDRSLDRKRMLDLLITDKRNLDRQLRVLKPYILTEIDKRVHEYHLSRPGRMMVVEAPLLFEYGEPERFEPVITVYAPKDLLIERLMKRSGRNRDWAASVVSLQIDIETKVQLSHYVIDNSGSLESTAEQVKEIHRKIREGIN